MVAANHQARLFWDKLSQERDVLAEGRVLLLAFELPKPRLSRE